MNFNSKTQKSYLVTSAVLFFAGLGTVSGQETTAKKYTIQQNTIDEVVIVGSRSGGRSKADSPVAVDVFNIKEALVSLPQTNINQILNSIAPSFTSTIQTNADGTDHLDPAQLRGLGPDQVLVLVNGKRRHTSALVNVNGSPGRGTVGTDLNAIPAYALNKIEVLRDGASAQYGSDAIAGVMNLILKKDTGKLTGQLNYGGYLTPTANDHTGNFDGQQYQLDLNYGNKIGTKGGFYNVTMSSQFREPTTRAGVESGALYNAYNAIEKRALNDGVNLYSLFSNINNTPNSQQLIDYIKQYAPKVGYFDPTLQNNIQNATSISALQGLLKGDVTDQELAYRGQERRDFNMQVGQSKLNNQQVFANIEVPLNDDWKVYTFGGYGKRHGSSGGFYRRPNQARTFTGLYPDGYLPNIVTDIEDVSLSSGIKGQWSGWNVDLSNTFGQNSFDYTIKNTGNTSLRFASPNSFKAGGLQFLQNTVNLDLSKNFDVWSGINVAFGGEQRHENFKITPGEEASYTAYDVFGNPQTVTTPANQKPTDFFGAALAGGSQVFAGFRDANRTDKSRNSYAAYADVEFNFTKWLLVDAAIRYENYSDFGSTFNYKLASRIKLTDDLNFRFAGSTGFRAPSIHQIYYNTTSTLFSDGVLKEVGTFSNDSYFATTFGIPKLKQETSKSISTGFTYKIPNLNLNITADAYFIRIDDRIVLTDQFSRPTAAQVIANPSLQGLQQKFDEAGVTAAQFFANSIDTETKGLDIVISHNYRTGAVKLNNDFAINFNKTRKVGDVHTSEGLRNLGLETTFFSEKSRIYLEDSVPKVKASLSHNVSWKDFNFYLRNTYYGKVWGADIINANVPPYEHQLISDKVITDVSLGYTITKNVGLTLGVNNLFDIYPTKNLSISSNNDQFVYSRSTSQFGQNGRYVFSRVNFTF